MKILAMISALMFLPMLVSAMPAPAPVNEYPIHEDGGLIYDPMRREAERTGQLRRYDNAQVDIRTLNLGRYTLKAKVPKKMIAYDVVPIDYELTWTNTSGSFPVALEATAFEEESRRKGQNFFDLALPGRLDLDVDYLGSITAHLKPEEKHRLTPGFTDTPGKYPGFERKPLVKSGVVEAGDLVWFKFRYTNTGNTILDPEGYGCCQFFPELMRKNSDGNYEHFGHPYNLYIRDFEYLYPGESHEMWVHFQTKGAWETPQNFGLTPGEYLIKIRMVYRNYKNFDPWINIWEGPMMYVFEMPVTVEAEPRQTAVSEGKVTYTDGGDPDKITRWIHTHEEFMTAFDCHISQPERARKDRKIKGTLHLQIAPWTENIVIKLIGTNPVQLNTVAVPVVVDTDKLKIMFNPYHKMNVIKDGMKYPCIWSQSMADMRTNVQHSPFPEIHIRERLREMKDCGVNVVSFTSMPWLYDDMHNWPCNYQGDAWKYFLDCMRDEGDMWAEGWGTYPYDRASIQTIHNWITGENLQMDNYMTNGYPAISHVDPDLPRANASAWLYQFYRWGDLYYQMERGDVTFGIEDTRGWMRQDVNIRFPMGDASLAAFRAWVKDKYGTVGAVNKAWGSSYISFGEINPEANQVENCFGHHWEYTNPERVFHDWSPAIADFDQFRTEVRMKNYFDTMAIVRKEIPQAQFLLRTEGANVLVKGIDPADPNTHMRHIFYSQRRCGAVADFLVGSGALKWHSDYTILPYTPSELSELVSMAVEQDIIPIYLPQFDHMRDIAINEKYGTPFEIHYNLPSPKKGQMMHTLTSLYPWFKAVYEAGGVPGILWEDLQCDGFATVTQKREMKFFKKKLEEALNTPEAIKVRKDVKLPSQEWRQKSKAMRSYVQSEE